MSQSVYHSFDLHVLHSGAVGESSERPPEAGERKRDLKERFKDVKVG